MFTLLLCTLVSIRSWFQSHAALQVEVLALRRHLMVLKRSKRRRLRLNSTDRRLCVWLYHFWASWRSALFIVKPETVIAWHRRGFRCFWGWKSRQGELGRPTVDLEVQGSAQPRTSTPEVRATSGRATYASGDLYQSERTELLRVVRHPDARRLPGKKIAVGRFSVLTE